MAEGASEPSSALVPKRADRGREAFGRIDVLCPKPAREVVTTSINGNVFFHPVPFERGGLSGGGAVVRWIGEEGARERPLVTIGDDVVHAADFLAPGADGYTAARVVELLDGGT